MKRVHSDYCFLIINWPNLHLVMSWEKVGECPFVVNGGTLLKGVNDGELLFVSNKLAIYYAERTGYNYIKRDSQIHVWKNNKWETYVDTLTPKNMHFHQAALDENKGTLYISGLEDQTHSNQCSYNERNMAIVLNNRFHSFGYGHFIFDEIEKKFISQQPSHVGSAIVYISSRGCLLKIGGKTPFKDTIHLYDLKNKLWTECKLKLPKPLEVAVYATTNYNGNKFVLIFGGLVRVKPNNLPFVEIHPSNDIYVLDTTKMIIKRSKVQLPQCYRKYYKVVVPNSEINDELTSFGFVRKLWQKTEFNDLLFPPHYLIRLISLFYNNDYVHLINADYTDKFKGWHWRMKVDTILDCY
eukprot:528605_1